MKKLIIATLITGFAASAHAYDPLQNEPGFYWEYLTPGNKAAPSTTTQPEVGARSDSMKLFKSSSDSYESAESKNR